MEKKGFVEFSVVDLPPDVWLPVEFFVLDGNIAEYEKLQNANFRIALYFIEKKIYDIEKQGNR